MHRGHGGHLLMSFLNCRRALKNVRGFRMRLKDPWDNVTPDTCLLALMLCSVTCECCILSERCRLAYSEYMIYFWTQSHQRVLHTSTEIYSHWTDVQVVSLWLFVSLFQCNSSDDYSAECLIIILYHLQLPRASCGSYIKIIFIVQYTQGWIIPFHRSFLLICKGVPGEALTPQPFNITRIYIRSFISTLITGKISLCLEQPL